MPVSESHGKVMEAGERGLYAQAWGASFILHGIAVMLAALLVAQMKPIPLQEVFHWNVSLVELAQEQPAETQGDAMPPMLVSQPQVRPMKQVSSASQAVLQEVQTRQSSFAAKAPRQSFEATKLIERQVLQPAVPSSVVEQQVPTGVQTLKPVSEANLVHETVPMPESVTGSAAASIAETEKPLAMQPTASTETDSSPSEKTRQKVDADASHGNVPSQLVAVPQDLISPLWSVESVQKTMKAMQQTPSARADYGWLIESLSTRLAELKRYPAVARSSGLEGKVLLRAVILADGHLADVSVQKSSGHEELDAAAMQTMREASPMHLRRELGRAQITVTVPLVYKLAN
ncbi:MAG: energy transducer TonB [Nitrospira sp.]|nr:energy transducer TonB [Nitrospira sp.]